MTFGWLSELIAGIAKLLKVLFGTDKPAKIEIHDARDSSPGFVVPSDEQWADDLGLRRVDTRPDHEG